MTRHLTLVCVMPWLLLATSVHAGALPAAACDRLSIDGTEIGVAIVETKRIGDEVFTEERMELAFRLGGRRETLRSRSVWVEGVDGRPRRFLSAYSSGRTRQRVEALVDDGALLVSTHDHDGTQQQRIAIGDDLLFPRALAARVAAVHRDSAATLSGAEFDARRLRVDAVTYTQRRVDASDHRDRALRPWQRRRGGEDGVRALQWDPAGARFLHPLSVAGRSLQRQPGSLPCLPAPEADIDLLDALLRPAPYRIPRALLDERLRFALVRRSGLPLTLPETGEQSVRERAARSVVTICADCGTEPAPSEATLRGYLRANDWVRSDHPRIRLLSHRAGAGTIATRMTRLTRLVQKEMTGAIELADYADAVSALKSRSGDCTEFAVLLAALARAAGIPTRVVAGMAYSARFTGRRHVFSPHTWVQAWNGTRWQSFDAGLGEFNSGHIALAIGDGRPADYAGVLATLGDLDVVDAGRIVDATAH